MYLVKLFACSFFAKRKLADQAFIFLLILVSLLWFAWPMFHWSGIVTTPSSPQNLTSFYHKDWTSKSTAFDKQLFLLTPFPHFIHHYYRQCQKCCNFESDAIWPTIWNSLNVSINNCTSFRTNNRVSNWHLSFDSHPMHCTPFIFRMVRIFRSFTFYLTIQFNELCVRCEFPQYLNQLDSFIQFDAEILPWICFSCFVQISGFERFIFFNEMFRGSSAFHLFHF